LTVKPSPNSTKGQRKICEKVNMGWGGDTTARNRPKTAQIRQVRNCEYPVGKEGNGGFDPREGGLTGPVKTRGQTGREAVSLGKGAPSVEGKRIGLKRGGTKKGSMCGRPPPRATGCALVVWDENTGQLDC